MNRNRRLIPAVLMSGFLIALAFLPVRADYREAVSAFESKDYARAAELFHIEVESAPNYDFGWYMLGMCSVQQKQWGEAEEFFNKAIELNPNKFSYYQGIAKLHADQGDREGAIAILEERAGLAESDQEKRIMHTTLGTYYAKLNKHGQAIPHLEEAKAIGASAGILTQLGISYYNLNDFDNAIKNLAVVAEKQPNNKNLIFFLGNSYLNNAQRTRDEATKLRLYDEAVRRARTLILLDQSDWQYHNLLARSLFGSKRFGDALTSFNTVLRTKPDYCYAYTNIGKVYLAQNSLDQAEITLRKGVECDDANHLTWETLGSVLESRNEIDGSLKAFQEASDIQPTSVSLKGVERLTAKVTNRDLEQEQVRLDRDAEERFKREQAAYEKYQENLDKFYDKDGDGKRDDDNDGQDDGDKGDSGEGDGGEEEEEGDEGEDE